MRRGMYASGRDACKQVLGQQLWVIEARNADGSLDLQGAQPESVFGHRAINGITEDHMAKLIYARKPEAILRGDQIALWPTFINEKWRARRKYW